VIRIDVDTGVRTSGITRVNQNASTGHRQERARPSTIVDGRALFTYGGHALVAVDAAMRIA